MNITIEPILVEQKSVFIQNAVLEDAQLGLLLWKEKQMLFVLRISFGKGMIPIPSKKQMYI